MPAQDRRQRIPQETRRVEVIDAALIEFGKYGYAGTSTSMIATRAGIRQPYIYALFENKRDLFLACHEVLNLQILQAFNEAFDDEDSPYERLRKMGLAYLDLLNADDRTRCHLHIFAAAGVDDLKTPIREGFYQFFEDVIELSGATRPEVARFLATGVLVNAMTALEVPSEMIGYLEMIPGGAL